MAPAGRAAANSSASIRLKSSQSMNIPLMRFMPFRLRYYQAPVGAGRRNSGWATETSITATMPSG